MLQSVLAPSSSKLSDAKTVTFVDKAALDELDPATQKWVQDNRFTGKAGSVLLLPSGDDGSVAAALLGVGDGSDPFCSGALAGKLPEGWWCFDAKSLMDLRLASIGFLLGSYRFETFKKQTEARPALVLDPSLDRNEIVSHAEATWMVRDLVNTPTNQMGPDDIEAASRALGKSTKATTKVVKGDELLSKGFPMVHAVGRASAVAPRLIDMTWGSKKSPKLTLVGKGVAFDTGGLDIKPASAMRNMKKDMGGAANVLGLAKLIMDAKLPVRLRVLIPAVENSISANAFRPGDILESRKGLTVEIGHTDAEGRLVLADALTLACEEEPDLVIDMATLTGAARVALGPELPPFYTNDEGLADSLNIHSVSEHDPVWRMPLWQDYNRALASKVADLNNVTTDGFAGSITAALFLQRFVTAETSWAHFDIFAWNPTSKPHAPVGGEAQAIRTLFAAIKQRYA